MDNTYTNTLHTTYTPFTLESSLNFLAYCFTTLPNQYPCLAFCCTPIDPPLAHRFCNHFITAQPCYIVTICLFFQLSLCRNRFSINRCSDQFCSRFAGICCANQSLYRLSSRPVALCRSLLSSSPSTYR